MEVPDTGLRAALGRERRVTYDSVSSGDWRGDDGYNGWFNGTSASAPVVSGTVALMFAANPRLTAAQARAVLCETAVKNDVDNGAYDAEGRSWYYGCGRLDAGAAVLGVANEAPRAPAVIAPRFEAWADRVLLTWAPSADADGDWLDYTVTWWPEGHEDQAVTQSVEGRTSLDLTGSVAIGDRVVFEVRAEDLFGPGPASDPRTFTVVDYTPSTIRVDAGAGSGCSLAPSSPPASAILALALAALALRRRTSRP